MERLLEERRVSIIQRHVLPENETYTRIKLVADVSLGKTVHSRNALQLAAQVENLWQAGA